MVSFAEPGRRARPIRRLPAFVSRDELNGRRPRQMTHMKHFSGKLAQAVFAAAILLFANQLRAAQLPTDGYVTCNYTYSVQNWCHTCINPLLSRM